MSSRMTPRPASRRSSLSSAPVLRAGANASIAAAAAKWVGEKLASGIVGAAGGKIFSEVMDAIGFGGPDYREKLESISGQISDVQRTLNRLTEMTTEILKQLNELRAFLEASLQVQDLKDAMDKINAVYGSTARRGQRRDTATPVAPVSLHELTVAMPRFATKDYLQKAAKIFATSAEQVPAAIETIYRVLVDASLGQTNLPRKWARQLGQQVRDKKIGRQAAYDLLEGYFLFVISLQLKGVCIRCVALATEDLGSTTVQHHGLNRIQSYLQGDFAEKMKVQTRVYVEAVECLTFTILDPIMLSGGVFEMSERDFPQEFDPLLLRADLLAAALNLVGYQATGGTPAPSIQAAIQGIYGRSLFRPSDFRNSKPPVMKLHGYADAEGKAVHELDIFPVLDLVAAEGAVWLGDVAKTFSSSAHYFWRIPTGQPAAGNAIDNSYRGGVTPAFYPVFGADQPVLAAGIFDANPLFRGVPAAAPHSAVHTELPNPSNDLTFHDRSCTSFRHPLTQEPGNVFDSSVNVKHMHRAKAAAPVLVSKVVQPLFVYNGSPKRIRLCAHVTTVLSRDPRLDLGLGSSYRHRYDLMNHLKLRRRNHWEQEIYHSANMFTGDASLSLDQIVNISTDPLDNKRAEKEARLDFDLEAGEYDLVLDNVFWIQPTDDVYKGWQSSTLTFTLRAVTIEMIYPSTDARSR